MRLEARSLSLALSLGVIACAANPAAPTSPASTSDTTASAAAERQTLYHRLGGRDGIDAVVATFVVNVGRDPRIQLRFLFTDLDSLRGHLSEQICEASGGPCKYTGKPMKSGHAGMQVRDAEFDAMAEDLTAALKAHGVGPTEQKELLAAIGSLRPEIVESPAP
jgi:hemoglobin